MNYDEDTKLLEFPESAVAVCVSSSGSLLLVRQHRELHDRETIELPGGRCEQHESPVEAAKRELLEESGVLGLGSRLVLSVDLDFSASTHVTHIVKFLRFDDQQEAGKFQTVWLPLSEAQHMIEIGQITHAPTIIAVAMDFLSWKD